MVNFFILLMIAVLVVFSGLFSGLTLGLLSLDKTELERKIKLGDEKARKVYSVRRKGNLLLCTLLLGNVGVNSTIAILLGNVATGVVAGFIATALIVVFGEILPQAFISRYALEVGSRSVWIVKFFIIILYPICWPIAKTLDWMLGDEMGTVWSRSELKEIITHHRKSKSSNLDYDEERILLGALSFSDKVVKDIMISRNHVFALEADEIIDNKMLVKMKKFGFSRFPVYEKKLEEIKGVFFLRDLAGISEYRKAGAVCDGKFFKVFEDRKLDGLLRLFIMKRMHFAVVFDRGENFVGVVTLEDVIEEVIGREIVDEDDFFEDVEKGKRAS